MILEMISRKRTWKIFARDDVSCKKFIETKKFFLFRTRVSKLNLS